MRVETDRMYLYPLSDEEMQPAIEKESDPEMKQAYTEMLEGCISDPDNRIWYAIWNMELKDAPGRIVGDFCFKGNVASQNVLFRAGFVRNGKMGEEGPRFVYCPKI